jgi:hypothetical protein
MRTRGGIGVGRFSVEFEVANNDDVALARRGVLPAAQVRRETIRGVVDSGATMLVLPQAVVKRLGLAMGVGSRFVTPMVVEPSAARPRVSSSNSWDAIAPSMP